jgi:hypothetical protein
VTYPLTGRSRAIIEQELGGTAEAIYLVDLPPAARAHALGRAEAVLSHDTSKELRRRDPVTPQCPAVAVHRRWRRLGADPRFAAGIAGCRQ